MSKFHVNPETGSVSRCRAVNGGCPFGGESGTENHFESIQEAKSTFENSMKDSILKTHSKQSNSKELDEVQEELTKLTKDWKKLDSKLKAITTKSPNFKFTRSWYNYVQERKNLYYKMRVVGEQRDSLLDEETKKSKEEARQAKIDANEERMREWRTKKEAQGGFSYHPEIDSKNEKLALSTLTSFGGISEDEARELVDAKVESGLSRTEAYRKVWSELPMRSDKPIVTLDLEVAAPMINGRVDMGPYSSIIEVGYVKRYPDGRTEEKTYLCGVPDDLKEVEGTGAEHIHNITPEMVEGLKPFSDDVDKQKELLKDLRGSVLVAHNAKYETTQFTHNIPGFASLMDRGGLEVLDTQQVCRFYCPETPDNTNKSFVEANGGKYEGSHRALSDAKMTLNALFSLKGVK